MKDPEPTDMNGPTDRSVDQHTRLDAEALYRRHAGYVAGFLARLGVHAHEMDDLLQDVFLVAHQRGGYEPGPARPTTWLAEIAFRVAANARRAKRRLAPPTDRADELAGGGDPSEALEARRRRERLEACLASLDDEHRLVLVLFEIEGHPCAEIAHTLGVPVGTIHSRLHTARKRFQRAWNEASSERRPR